MATEEHIAIIAATRAAPKTSQPGDGIHPTHEEFYAVATASYNFWTTESAETDGFDIERHLFDLIAGVPPFTFPSGQRLSWVNGRWLHLKCKSEWGTTKESACDAKVKTHVHYLALGSCMPILYQHEETVLDSALPPETWSSLTMPCLIRAWCYILSCRWVESLAMVGEDARLFQSTPLSLSNFWETVITLEWHAVVIGDRIYHAPWSWSKNDSPVDIDGPVSPPNSTLALEALEDFCVTEDLQKESLLALCAAIILSQYPETMVTLPKCSLPTPKPSRGQKSCHKLNSLVDKCITLSCTPEGIESILASLFLDPGVPCNLVGAYFLGVRHALLDRGPIRWLEKLVIDRMPAIAPLWKAAIWCGKAEDNLGRIVRGYSNLQLPLSTWIGIPQSFIQYDYISDGPPGMIPRANEYRIAFLVDPDPCWPWAPYPPFGYTKEKNLSLEVHSHLSHDHHPQSYKMFWVVDEGEDILAQSLELPRRSARLWSNRELPLANTERFQSEYLDDAEGASVNATMNIINWHLDTEDALWLDMGNADKTRRFHGHPWIYDDCESDHESTGSVDSVQQEVDPAQVHKWLDRIG